METAFQKLSFRWIDTEHLKNKDKICFTTSIIFKCLLDNAEYYDELYSPEIETCLGVVAGASVVLSFLAEKSRAMATKK